MIDEPKRRMDTYVALISYPEEENKETQQQKRTKDSQSFLTMKKKNRGVRAVTQQRIWLARRKERSKGKRIHNERGAQALDWD